MNEALEKIRVLSIVELFERAKEVKKDADAISGVYGNKGKTY